jgi:hypothetical protein
MKRNIYLISNGMVAFIEFEPMHYMDYLLKTIRTFIKKQKEYTDEQKYQEFIKLVVSTSQTKYIGMVTEIDPIHINDDNMIISFDAISKTIAVSYLGGIIIYNIGGDVTAQVIYDNIFNVTECRNLTSFKLLVQTMQIHHSAKNKTITNNLDVNGKTIKVITSKKADTVAIENEPIVKVERNEEMEKEFAGDIFAEKQPEIKEEIINDANDNDPELDFEVLEDEENAEIGA